MKLFKKLLLILIVLCIIPNVYAADDVVIESIDVLEKSDNTDVITPAKADGLEIDFDIKFLEQHDYITYKVVLANSGNKEYKITNTTKFTSSDHIKYEYLFNNNNNIVKPNSKQEMRIKVSYERLVNESEMDSNGEYTETRNMVLRLARDNSVIKNPKTNSTIIALLLIITFIVCATSIVKIRKTNKVTALLLLIGFCVLSLPITILAIEELEIKVNSKVTINSYLEFCVFDNGLTVAELLPEDANHGSTLPLYKYKAIKGMTWFDFKNSKFYNQVGNETPASNYVFEYYGNMSQLNRFFSGNSYNLNLVKTINGEESRVNPNDIILSCDEGYYYISIDES